MSNVKMLPLLGHAAPSAVQPCCPPLSERTVNVDEAERAAKMFKALGDPVRLRLFAAVASRPGGETCVCDIPDVGVSQPTVSHHLKKLKEAGLLVSERPVHRPLTGWPLRARRHEPDHHQRAPRLLTSVHRLTASGTQAVEQVA